MMLQVGSESKKPNNVSRLCNWSETPSKENPNPDRVDDITHNFEMAQLLIEFRSPSALLPRHR
jgi:hypothetical protein